MSDEEYDVLDLPEHLQSGLSDTNTISEITRQTTTQEQEMSGALDNILNTYYGEHSTNQNINNMRTSLQDLGYTEARIDRIVQSAETEHEYRSTHQESSNLAPNQLAYLDSSDVRIYDLVINSDSEGLFYYDRRVHDVDDHPTKIYLPQAIEFDPLTREQRQEATEREDVLSYIYIEPTTPEEATALGRYLTQDQRIEISQITMDYLNGGGTEADKLRYTHNIQQIEGLSNVENIQEILYQYFIDVDFEYNYRQNNNGLPQGLSQEQYDYMRQRQQTYRYIGQPILFTDDGTAYYHIGGGQMLVPPQEDIERFNPREPRAGGQRLLTNQQEHDVNSALSQYFIRDDYEEVDFLNHLQDLVHLNDEDAGDMAISTSLNNLVIDATRERDYRQANNGRPSQLSQIQYDFLTRSNMYLEAGGHRYQQEPIQMIDGQLAFVSQLDSMNDYVIIPTDEQINAFIEQGRYSLPETPDYGPEVPEDLETDIPQEDIDLLSQPVENIDSAPIVVGQTQPIDPISGEDIPVLTPPEAVERYEQYFNDNQNLYSGFRNQFRDLLPVFGGVVGGFFAFSVARMRERNTVETILNEERILLDSLENRLLSLNERLTDNIETLQQTNQALTRKELVLQSYSTNPRVEQQIGRDAQLRGTMRFQKQVNELLEQVEIAQGQVDSIEMDIANEDTLQSQLNDKINDLINTDYRILQSAMRYSPQILSGISIGTTLGLVLSGYLFPTYESINEPYIQADNVEYTKKKKKPDKIEKIENRTKLQVPRSKSISQGSINDLNKIQIKGKKDEKTFIPLKDQKGGPLTYKQIQEYKSTLSSFELDDLKGKYLIFGDGGNIKRVDDKCKSVVGETQIFQQPIF